MHEKAGYGFGRPKFSAAIFFRKIKKVEPQKTSEAILFLKIEK